MKKTIPTKLKSFFALALLLVVSIKLIANSQSGQGKTSIYPYLNLPLYTTDVSITNNSPFTTTTFIPNRPKPDALEFEVKVLSPRRFSVSFYNNQNNYVFIKIYDVIGNLVLPPEMVTSKGPFRKEYDISGQHTEFLIVEVGNGKASTTKRLLLN